jgi:hypothetical protein
MYFLEGWNREISKIVSQRFAKNFEEFLKKHGFNSENNFICQK